MSEPDKREPVDAFLKRTLGVGDEIKPGRETRILQDDPALAHEVDQRLRMEPLPEGVVAPITLSLPKGIAPLEYVIHVWTHKCSICNTEHKHSEVYAVNHLRGAWGRGIVRNMSPVTRLEWQVPIKVHNITTRTTAGCFECLDALRDEVLPSLPLPPVPEAIVSGGKDKGAEGTSTKPSASQTKPKKTLTTDDFDI